MNIEFNKIDNILTIDNKNFEFNIKSEMTMQELHKENKFKFMKNEKEILNIRQGINESLLNFDISVLKYFLYSCQQEESKLNINDFTKYYDELIKNNPSKINEVFVNCFLLFGGYMQILGFKFEIERGLLVMQKKMEMKMLSIIQTFPNSIQHTIKSRLMEVFKNFVS